MKRTTGVSTKIRAPQIEVISVPSGHPYPMALRPSGGWRGIAVPPDPIPDPEHPERWWPHPALEAGFWRHRGPTDSATVLHIHFGFEHRSPEQLVDLCAAIQDAHVPLVLTVHDLDNPHLDGVDQMLFHEQLAVLVHNADALLTLTEQARAHLLTWYHREATVVPHPAVVPTELRQMRLAHHPRHSQCPERPVGVGVFCKSLRTNMVADPDFYRAVARDLARYGCGPLRVFVHRGSERGEQLCTALECAPEASYIQVIRHDPMNDTELFDAVTSCRVVLLPYTHGTHSGWLEMCRDLGVPVAVPDCGCFLSQADRDDAVAEYPTSVAERAAQACRKLWESGHVAYHGDRETQQVAVQNLHRDLYRRLVRGGE